ncbi:hypothetical protein Btru_054121 [Bulinus truncatus]|nr:hypothetical protein Btru_054121 [Bulinus truncatus]
MDFIVKLIHQCTRAEISKRNIQLVSVALCLVICLSEVIAVYVTPTTQFTREIGCYASANQSLVLTKCLVPKESRSLLHCIALCSASGACNGAVKNSTGRCYFYTVCDYITLGNCGSQGVNKITVYRKQVNNTTSVCANEGTFNPVTGMCSCSPGWSGVYCDTPPTICSDAANTTGVFWMDVKLSSLVRVLCDVATPSGSFKIYAFKNDGTSYHNKTWAQYSQGYHIDDNNFWLGLENMRTILSQNVTNVRLEVVFSNSSIFHYWDNSGIAISNSSTNYTLTFLASKNNGSQLSWIGFLNLNCLTSGKQFSTIDVDNDGDAQNLAAQGNAGWWFEDSSVYNVLKCNPMGRLSGLMQSSTFGNMVIAGLNMDTGKYVSFFRYVAMYFYK